MGSFAGVIHPSAFQTTELMDSMMRLFRPHSMQPSAIKSGQYRFKNLELGISGNSIAYNEQRTRLALLDGKILNASELRHQLKNDLGYKFASNDDAEVLIHAYDAWKEDFISRLRGFFAFALFDEEAEAILLARDPLGKKTLFWASLGNYFLFSTELKAILATGVVPQTPALEGLASYLHFGCIPQDLSPIKGVNKLLPCHFLKLNLNRQLLIGQYWSYSASLQSKISISQEEADEEFHRLFQEILNSSLSKEEKIPLFFSSNLGSCSLVCYLENLTNKERISPYSVSFDASEKEQENLSMLTETFDLNPRSKMLTPEDALNDLVKIVWYQDEPISSFSSLEIWNLARLASQESQPVFSSVGWEELFAGNARYFLPKRTTFSFTQKLAHISPKVRDILLFPILNVIHSQYKYRLLRNLDIDLNHLSFVFQNVLFSEKQRKKVSPFLYRYFDPEVFTQRLHRLSAFENETEAFLYYDFKTELPDRTLAQYEHLLKSFGIDLVAPFLDERIVQFLAKLPAEIKFPEGQSGAMLRRLLYRACPKTQSIAKRISTPTPLPECLEKWRLDSRFREVFELLKEGLLAEEGIISSRWIKQQLGYPYIIPEAFAQLWALLVLEIWFRLYINLPVGRVNLDVSVKEFLKN